MPSLNSFLAIATELILGKEIISVGARSLIVKLTGAFLSWCWYTLYYITFIHSPSQKIFFSCSFCCKAAQDLQSTITNAAWRQKCEYRENNNAAIPPEEILVMVIFVSRRKKKAGRPRFLCWHSVVITAVFTLTADAKNALRNNLQGKAHIRLIDTSASHRQDRWFTGTQTVSLDGSHTTYTQAVASWQWRTAPYTKPLLWRAAEEFSLSLAIRSCSFFFLFHFHFLVRGGLFIYYIHFIYSQMKKHTLPDESSGLYTAPHPPRR